MSAWSVRSSILAALVVSAAVSVGTQAPALRVVNAGPTGELGQIADADEVRILFSEPMVALGTVPAMTPPAWVSISPAAPGSFYWNGTRTLMFSPDAERPLPFATKYTIRVDASAASVAGRTLGAPHEFSFTTPTVRLLAAEWYRKDGRFDQPAVISLRFNQRVRPADVLAHLRVHLTPHNWTSPTMSEPAREFLRQTDRAGLDRFDAKVAAVRRVVSSSEPIGARLAETWDERRFPPAPERVVLETAQPAPTDGWLTTAIDASMPSPDGPATGSAQSSIVRLDPTFFVTRVGCLRDCNPSSYNSIQLSRQGTMERLSRAMSVVDVTDPRAEQPVTRKSDALPRPEQISTNPRPQDLGFDAQPPMRTWRLRLDAALESTDGQVLGYPWVEVIENIHEPHVLGVAGMVWEAGAGATVPLSARNVLEATEWVAPLDLARAMPRLMALRQQPNAPLPSVPPVRRRLPLTFDTFQAYGLDLSALLSPRGTGLVSVATSPSDLVKPIPPVPGSVLRQTVVQVTNLGIHVKDSPHASLVFVTRLDTGAPVRDANVTIVDSGNQTRWRGVTDADGVALVPAMTLRPQNRQWDLTFIVAAEKDGDVAFVGSDWTENLQPYSWGLPYQPGLPDTQLRGSVFTDRGVYRETDEVHLKAVLRDDTTNGMRLASEGGGFVVLLRDSQDREVERRTLRANRWSSLEWTWRVPAGAPLGRYTVQIVREDVNPALVYSNANGGFLVAAYRRPDFRVDASLEAEPLDVARGQPAVLGSTLRGTVDAKYLFGGALGSRPVRWWFGRSVTQAPPAALREKYPNARFAVGYLPDPNTRRNDAQLPTKTQTLGPDGRVSATLPTIADADTAFTYNFEGDVEDVSGQHIANRSSVVVHPAALYVAISRPPMFVTARTGASVGLTAVDLTGRPVADVPIAVSLFREEWMATRRPDNPYFVQWERKETPAGDWTVRSTSTETPLTIPLTAGGKFIVRATARDASGRATRTDLFFYATGPGKTPWRSEENRIDLTPERQTWKPGERARILIQSPWEQATALLTVEREGVLRHRRFDITSTQDTIDVPVTDADVPNVFVSVVLVKGRTATELAPDGTDAGRPAFRVGYTQLTIDDASKRLRVDVTADREDYRPRQPARVNVKVAGADGAPVAGEVTLWAMDYGLLSLTGYSTPDVVKAIYAPKPLQVTSEDNRQRLISRQILMAQGVVGGVAGDGPAPSPTPVQNQNMLMGVGGGRGGGVGGAAFRSSTVEGMAEMVLQPRLDAVAESTVTEAPGEIRQDFRPLVFWLGSTTTGADGTASTTVTLPDSLTTYRIMAVAGDRRSHFGFGEREIRVNKPLNLLAAFPRFLSKGDRAAFGAVVTNSSRSAGQATVTIASLDPATLTFSGPVTRTFPLAAGASEPVRFDALAGGSGGARVRVTVRLGADTDAFEMPLVVTAPMRLETVAAYGDTVATATERLALPPGILPDAGGLRVELASTALVGLGESARYLTEYPYECAEQRASRALALLLSSDLGGAFQLSGFKPDAYRSEGVAALNSLYGYQCGDGGFSLWPGSCYSTSPYLTAYILHVLRVAEGLKVPIDRDNSVNRALNYLQQHLQQPPPEVQWHPVWGASQTYAVKVLAEFGRSPARDISRLAGVADRLPVFALSYLADAMAAVRDRGPRYQDVTRRLANALRIDADRAHVEEVDDASLVWLWNTNVRATAVVLDGFARRGDDPAFVAPLVRWLVAARTNGRWATTHENATALEALVSYYRAFESEVPQMTASVRVGSSTAGSATFAGRSTVAQRVDVPMRDLIRQVTSATAPALTIAKTGTGRVHYTARVQYFAPETPEALDRGVRVERRYAPFVPDAERPAATTYTAGDLVRVTVTIHLRGEGRYLALTDPLPAGLEPLDGWFQTTASDLARQATRTTGSGGDWRALWRRGTFDHIEKHDNRVVAFATRLGSGKHEFSYLARATTPGTFTAAGARVEAMYAPEMTGRSAASRVEVR